MLSANDLPKGSRFVVTGPGGKAAMLFWYRDSVFAVEPRSPAEGAYSEGFVTARFTQDGCIECPTTKTTFDLATGAIKAWYPDNPVLRALTPIETCRPMDVFPARLSADGKTVEVAWGEAPSVGGAAVTSGGADSSIERNNVYGIEPRVYLEDGRTVCGARHNARHISHGGLSSSRSSRTPLIRILRSPQIEESTGRPKAKPAEIIVATVAIAGVAVAGSAVASACRCARAWRSVR